LWLAAVWCGLGACARPPGPLVWTKERQQALAPAEALDLLVKGNERSASGRQINHHLLAQAHQTAQEQHPFAAVLSCIDSRTSAVLVFDQGVGDIFEARIAGAVINPDIAASLEYSCFVAGSKLIAIVGHTGCGAVKGACDGVKVGLLPGLLGKIDPAVRATATAAGEERTSHNHEFVNRVAEANVKNAVRSLRAVSPLLSKMEREGKIAIVGGLHDLETGRVTFFP